jgi:hypothetical protein
MERRLAKRQVLVNALTVQVKSAPIPLSGNPTNQELANGKFPERGFWPGITSGLPVIRQLCRRAHLPTSYNRT